MGMFSVASFAFKTTSLYTFYALLSHIHAPKKWSLWKTGDMLEKRVEQKLTPETRPCSQKLTHFLFFKKLFLKSTPTWLFLKILMKKRPLFGPGIGKWTGIWPSLPKLPSQISYVSSNIFLAAHHSRPVAQMSSRLLRFLESNEPMVSFEVTDESHLL